MEIPTTRPHTPTSIQHIAGYKQEIKTSFVMPSVAAVAMGIVTYLVYEFLYYLTTSVFVSTVIAMIFAVAVYFVLLFLLKTLTKEELLDYPMGARIYRLCRKIKLMQ